MSPAGGEIEGGFALVYSLTKQDFAAFALRMGRRQASLHETRYGVASALALIGATLVALLLAWLFGLVESGPALALFPAAAAALAAAKIVMHRQIARAQQAAAAEAASDAALYEGERVLSLSRDGVTIQHDGATRRIAWSGIESVERAGGLVVLWTGLAEGVAVPERAFADEQGVLDFVARIKSGGAAQQEKAA